MFGPMCTMYSMVDVQPNSSQTFLEASLLSS